MNLFQLKRIIDKAYDNVDSDSKVRFVVYDRNEDQDIECSEIEGVTYNLFTMKEITINLK